MRRPQMLLRHTRARPAFTKKKQPRHLQLRIGFLRSIPPEWKTAEVTLTTALVSCQFSRKDSPEFFKVHSSKDVRLSAAEESEDVIVELSFSAGKRTPVAPHYDSTNMLVMLARRNNVVASANPELVLQKELELLFSMSADGKSVPKTWNETWRICIVELMPNGSTTMVEPHTGWELAGRRIRSMVWPPTTSRQRVFLVKCPRAQLGQENYQMFGDVSFDLVTSWKRKEASNDSSGAGTAAAAAATAGRSDDVAIVEASNENKQEKEPKVGAFFHFCFTDDSQPSTVKSVVQGCTALVCPWCNFCPGARGEQLELNSEAKELAAIAGEEIKFGLDKGQVPVWSEQSQLSVTTLMLHLQSFHPHFEHKPAVDECGNLHVVVRRDRERDWSVERLQREVIRQPLALSGNKRKALHTPDFSSWPIVPRTSGEQYENKPPAIVIAAVAAANASKAEEFRRPFYNARLGQRLFDAELGLDENDYDAVDQQERFDEQLDDFEDVGVEEKTFMKMWNKWVTNNKAEGDSRVALMCQQFIELHAAQILRLNLRHNLLLNFLNMYDFGVLSSDEVSTLMRYVDSSYMLSKMSSSSSSAGGAAAATGPGPA